jgi:mRNA interferase MazF
MREGYIVLIPLPQADGQTKLRPVLLLKKMHFPGDFLVAGLSSQLHQAVKGFDIVIAVGHPDYRKSGLRSSSVVRLGHLAIINETKIPGPIGSLSRKVLEQLKITLGNYIAA